MVGMYKLEMNFDGKVMSFVTKLKIASFERLLAANVIDLLYIIIWIIRHLQPHDLARLMDNH